MLLNYLKISYNFARNERSGVLFVSIPKSAQKTIFSIISGNEMLRANYLSKSSGSDVYTLKIKELERDLASDLVVSGSIKSRYFDGKSDALSSKNFGRNFDSELLKINESSNITNKEFLQKIKDLRKASDSINSKLKPTNFFWSLLCRIMGDAYNVNRYKKLINLYLVNSTSIARNESESPDIDNA
jgi:hypothetical protein